MAADIVARKLLSQKQNSPRVNRLLCLSRSVPGDETHVEDLPGGGQSNLERYIAYGRETVWTSLVQTITYRLKRPSHLPKTENKARKRPQKDVGVGGGKSRSRSRSGGPCFRPTSGHIPSDQPNALLLLSACAAIGWLVVLSRPAAAPHHHGHHHRRSCCLHSRAGLLPVLLLLKNWDTPDMK